MSGLFLSLFILSANNSFSLPEMWCLVKRWKYKSIFFFRIVGMLKKGLVNHDLTLLKLRMPEVHLFIKYYGSKAKY